MRSLPFLALSLGLCLAACSSKPPPCQSSCPCQAQSDCPAGQSCLAGLCAAATQSCVTDLDCTNPADVCVGGSCVLGSDDAGVVNDAGPDAGKVDGGRDAGPDAGPTTDGGKVDGGGDGGQSDAGDGGSDGGLADGGDAGFDAGQATDSGPTPDSGTGCSQPSDCATGVCTGGTCQPCTVNSCTTPLLCCMAGTCTAGTCVACTSDLQCNAPEEVCQAGSCVPGCLLGSCATGQRCDSAMTGRCQPASGSGGPGAACQSFADCAPLSSNSNGGDCLALLLVDGGVDSFCTFACQGTDQCPSGMVCALFGGGGQCIPVALAGGASYFGPGAIGATCSTSGYACDSYTGCGTYAAGGDVCSDTCLGPSSGVCPGGWQCNDVTYFSGVLDGGPGSCANNAQCTTVSPDALCFTNALGGDDKCHLVFQQDACYETAGGATKTTGMACTVDTDCKFGLCNKAQCADPCCASTDCPATYACAPIIEQQFSVLMACLPTTGTLALGAACDPTAPANSCSSLLPSAGGGVSGQGLCLPVDTYSGNTSTTGYCSDYCCNDTECGSGYTCTLLQIGTDNKGNGLFANACLKL